MGSNETWLRQQLAAALGWDDVIMEGVMDVIVNSKSEADIQDVVENFMNNDPKAVAIISEYMARRSGSTGSSKNTTPAQTQPPSSSSGAARQGPAGAAGGAGASYATHTGRGAAAGSQPSPSKQQAPKQQQQQQQQQGGTPDSWLVLDKHGQHQAGSSQQQQEAGGAAQEVAGPSSGGNLKAIDAAKATLSMFKQGGRLRSRGASSSKPQGQGQGRSGEGGGGSSSSSGSGLPERKVVNCLSCGKIYDCRSVTNDIIKFLERGGVCTFCGAKVALDYKERIAQQAAAAAEGTAAPSSDPDMAFGLTEGEESAATAAAVAFKDRLVEYDRNSAKRTTVIDDQSDYFEIDANAWLTDEERAELKRRRALEEAAAAARRNRLVVTIDLLGRKVLLPADGDAGSADSAGAGGGAGGSSSIQLGSSGAGGGSSAAAAGGGQVQGQKDGGGGAAGDGQPRPGPSPAEVAQALRALHHLPMTQAPGLKVPAPVFVPQKAREAAAAAGAAGRSANGTSASATSSGSKQNTGASGSSKAGQPQEAAKQQQQQQRQGQGKGGSRRKLRSRVVQDDSVFDEFGAELAYEQVAGAARGATGQQ